MNIEKILEYQALDQVIYKAEVEYANSDENKKYNFLRNRARACSDQLIKLDHETADIFKELDRKEAALADFNSEIKARPAAPKNLEQAGKSDDALKKLEEGLASLERECNRLFKRLEEIARESQQYYSQFVKLRGETLSCICDDGSVIETRLNSFLAGEDGKEGIRGRLVSKQGQLIARSLAAGFASGLSEAFDVNAVPTISTSSDGTVQYERVYSSEAMQGAAVKGFSSAMENISEFYLDMAREIFPVLEINAGRQVDVIVINGTELQIKAHSSADAAPIEKAEAGARK